MSEAVAIYYAFFVFALCMLGLVLWAFLVAREHYAARHEEVCHD